MMNDKATEYRIVRLEADNRRMKRILFGFILGACALPLLAFSAVDASKDAHYRIVHASKFNLTDPRTGTVRAELSHQTMAGGWAGITLWDNAGNPRGEFKLWEDGRTHVLFMDAQRKELFRAKVSADGTPSLAVGGNELIAK